MLRQSKKYIKGLSDASLGWIIFVMAFILRAGYVVYAYSNNVMLHFADDNLYFEIGQTVANQGRIFYETADWRYDVIGPFLPWVNGLIIGIFGENWLALFLFTALISAGISLLIYRTTLLIANRKAALLAGLWSVFYIYYIRYSPRAGKDIWMAFFLLLIIYLLIRVYQERENYLKNILLIALAYIASVHLDERFLVYGPFIFLFLAYIAQVERKQYKWIGVFIFVLLVALLLIPWNYYNFLKYDKFVLMTTRTERTTDQLLGVEHKDRPFESLFDSVNIYHIKSNQFDSVAKGLKTYTDGGYLIKPAQIEAMKQGHYPHRLTTTEALWMRLKILLRPFQWQGEYQKQGYYYVKYSFRHNLASFIFFGIIFIFSIPGFVWLYKNRRMPFYIVTVAIFIYLSIHVLAVPFTTERYRLPIAAFFIIAGNIGIYNVINYSLKKLVPQK